MEEPEAVKPSPSLSLVRERNTPHGTIYANSVVITPDAELVRCYHAPGGFLDQLETAFEKQAKETQAGISFWDESGFRANAVQGKTWGVKGQTP